MFFICISYGILLELCSPTPEYDTSQVQVAVEEYKQKYWTPKEDETLAQESEDGN